MTFQKAREWLKQQAGNRPYTIAYHELHHSPESGGIVAVECSMTILDRHGEHRHIQAYNQRNWECCIATMSAQLNPESVTQSPMENICPECTSTIDGSVCQSAACKSRLE